MQKSGTKATKTNKLPPSQLIGFIKRHGVPPMAALSNPKMNFSKSEILPTIPATQSNSQGVSPSNGPADTTTNTTNNNSNALHFTNASPPVRKQEPVMDMTRMNPVKMMSVETRDPMRVKQEQKPEDTGKADEVPETEVTHMIGRGPERMLSDAAKEMVQVKEKAAAVCAQDMGTEMSSIARMTEESGSLADGGSVTKTKKTPEQLQEAADRKVQKALDLFAQTPDVPFKSPDGTRYEQEFLNHLKKIQFTYAFKGFPLRMTHAARDKIAEGLLDSGVVKFMCDIVTEELSADVITSDDTQLAKNHRLVVARMLSTLMNYADCDDDVTYAIRDHPGILPAILKRVQEWTDPHLKKELQKEFDLILRPCLSVLHNVSMREDNYGRMRELDASSVLLPYLESHNDAYKLLAYATLADIVSEEEADKLSTSPHLARFLLNRLGNALAAPNHRCYGWSVKELVRAVRRLARNDANKRLLVEEGALTLLSSGAVSTFDDEKHGCMETLWVLSFDQQNVEAIMKDEELLEKIISASKDRSQPPSLRESANGILWQCRYALCKSEKYCEIGKQISREKPRRKKKGGKKNPQDASTKSVDDGTGKDDKKEEEGGEEGDDGGGKEESDIGHVMVSYQWADQQVVKTIRDVIRGAGFKVWMDIDNMGGSTLEAMAAAIEDSFAVLICMSQKYKDSPNTRAEAEYTFQQRKKIIPLIMQKGYRPDGWLGIILGSKLFYDFSGKYTFESRIDGLIKAVNVAAGKVEEVDAGGGIRKPEPLKLTYSVQPEVKPTAAARVEQIGKPAPPPVLSFNSKKIKAWTDADVKCWLTKFGLNGTQLERLTGREIAFLYNLRIEAPEFFYSTLDRKLQITTLSGLISFTEALDDLPST